MNTSPIRQPAFCLLCILALLGVVADRQRNPVKTLMIEKIESRYVADRSTCLSLAGGARRDCRALAELRYDVAITELERLRTEPVMDAPNNAPPQFPAANVALGGAGSPS